MRWLRTYIDRKVEERVTPKLENAADQSARRIDKRISIAEGELRRLNGTAGHRRDSF